MSPQEFSTLKRYSMKYARDVDDQDDLVLQAYEEGLRLGPNLSLPLLVNFMKLRGKERNRSVVGVKYGGKSIRDAWYYNPISLSAAGLHSMTPFTERSLFPSSPCSRDTCSCTDTSRLL
jgi:hypothetical protein